MLDIENIQQLLDKEVSRKEFLMHAGAALVAVVGVSSIAKNLLSSGSRRGAVGSTGYGASTYSGIPSKGSVGSPRLVR